MFERRVVSDGDIHTASPGVVHENHVRVYKTRIIVGIFFFFARIDLLATDYLRRIVL